MISHLLLFLLASSVLQSSICFRTLVAQRRSSFDARNRDLILFKGRSKEEFGMSDRQLLLKFREAFREATKRPGFFDDERAPPLVSIFRVIIVAFDISIDLVCRKWSFIVRRIVMGNSLVIVLIHSFFRFFLFPLPFRPFTGC
jgi:hypothetical protein